MSQPLPIPPGFDDLSIDDQIDYVTSLWDRIAADAEKVPIPRWHLEILRQRLQDPDEVSDWEVLEQELLNKLE